jgi:hypothetical protein
MTSSTLENVTQGEAMVVESRRGRVEFVSQHDDFEVARRLRDVQGDFARKLAFCRSWSYSQRIWAHYLVWEHEQPKVEPKITTGLEAIVAMFDHAAEKLKYPKITFRIDGQTIKLQRCGPNSRAPGAVNVTDGRPYSVGIWYGRIDRDGTTTIRDEAVLSFLRDFASDPERKAAEYGKMSGHCCFCNTELTDGRSVAVGFGPVCADNYGLKAEWKKAGKAEVAELVA